MLIDNFQLIISKILWKKVVSFARRKMFSQISHSHIIDNFWYGMYGEFNVIMMKDCGFANVTKLCKDGGKDFSNWSRNKASKKLIQALLDKQLNGEVCESTQYNTNEIPGIHPQPQAFKFIHNFNRTSTNLLICRTYCHPCLLPHIACWISPKFALKVSNIVNNYFISDYNYKLDETRMALYSVKDELDDTLEVLSQSQQTIASQQNENDKLHSLVLSTQDENDTLTKLIKEKNDTIGIKQESIHELRENIKEKEDQHDKWASTHAFTLLKTNDSEAILPYYVIKCLRGKVSHTISKLRLKHPKAQVIWQQHKIPNAVNLYSRLKSAKIIHSYRNYCIPTDNEEQFITTLNHLGGNDMTELLYSPFNNWVPN